MSKIEEIVKNLSEAGIDVEIEIPERKTAEERTNEEYYNLGFEAGKRYSAQQRREERRIERERRLEERRNRKPLLERALNKIGYVKAEQTKEEQKTECQ